MAARKRSEVVAMGTNGTQQVPLTSVEERTIPLPQGQGEKPEPMPRYPLEDDLSAMCIRLKEQKGFKVPLTEVADWEPRRRHVVAMWLAHVTEDVPAIVQRYPRTLQVPSEPDAHYFDPGDVVAVHRPGTQATDDSADVGESVTVTLSEDTYTPAPYNVLKVGGFASTTTVRHGETRASAGRRALADLHALYDEEFRRKSEVFMRNLRGLKGGT